MKYRIRAQAGIALPVMLIILAVMMISSIYLLRSSTSTTLTTSNLAYDSALSKAADLGIYTGIEWMTGVVDKSVLQADSELNGYRATLAEGVNVGNPAFWQGARTITDNAKPKQNRIEYVIHRLCDKPGAFNSTAPVNRCTLTAAKKNVAIKGQVGASQASDAPEYEGKPKIHYVITSRIAGDRGGNVVNQAVVMLGP